MYYDVKTWELRELGFFFNLKIQARNLLAFVSSEDLLPLIL